jgi:hypothetical protein
MVRGRRARRCASARTIVCDRLTTPEVRPPRFLSSHALQKLTLSIKGRTEVEMIMTLTGKRALVTGASRRIGAAIPKALVAEGSPEGNPSEATEAKWYGVTPPYCQLFLECTITVSSALPVLYLIPTTLSGMHDCRCPGWGMQRT